MDIDPPVVAATGGFVLLLLLGSIQPLANIVRYYICYDRTNDGSLGL